MRPFVAQFLSAGRCKIAAALACHLVIAALSTAAARGDDFKPYRARVTSASAAVLSGPGEQFYPTDTLAEGDTIEVYRQNAVGWCAVRPPEGSFSWVFGRHVRLRTTADGDSVAEIDKDDVASRIGSRLSAHRNAVQVRLKKGEVLRVIGEEEADGEKWYKVSPPAGEFRWIHGKSLERIGAIGATPHDAKVVMPEQAEAGSTATAAATPPVANAIATEPITAPTHAADQASNTSPAVLGDARYGTNSSNTSPPVAPPLPPPAPVTDEWRSAPERPATTSPGVSTLNAPPLGNYAAPEKEAASAAAAGTLPATTPPRNTEITPLPAASSIPQNSAAANPVANEIPAIVAPATPASVPPIASVSTAPPANSQSLTQIELRLSRMVAEPPAVWSTAPLKAEAETLLAQSPISSDRAAIQTTIAKIDRFAAIERRYRGIAPGDTQGYDAIGVLRPVASRRPGAPPFALIDDRGQVVSFVTPTPGVNLQSLVGQRIGINGTRGYIPEFQRGHVVAGRAAPVADRIVR